MLIKSYKRFVLGFLKSYNMNINDLYEFIETLGGAVMEGVSCNKRDNIYYVHLEEKRYSIGSVLTAARRFVEDYFIKVDYEGYDEYIVRFKPKGGRENSFEVTEFYRALKNQTFDRGDGCFESYGG